MTTMPATLTLLSFLILFLHTNLLAYSQVLDIDGNPLRPGVGYFIQPAARGTIGLSKSPNCTSPLDVVLQTDITERGFPVIFSSVNPDDDVIKTEVDLNIEFNIFTICITSTVWRIKSSTNQSTGATQFFVTAGGVKGNPGQATLSNWFKIRSYRKGAYMLTFCPTVCRFCRPVCGNIGVIVENGIRRLGITFDDQPLIVSFVSEGLSNKLFSV